MNKEFTLANSINEATKLKDKDSLFYAGGTEINRLNSGLQDKSLISIKKLGLNEIILEDGFYKIGACSTFQSIIDSAIAPKYLKNACYFMASRTKRNMATIGGNIALKRFDSYLIPTLVVSSAKLVLQNRSDDVCIIELIDYLETKNIFDDSLILYILIPNNEVSVKSKRCANTVLSHAYITVSVSCMNGKYSVFAGLKNDCFAKLSTVVTVLNKKKSVSQNDICDLVNSTNEIHFYDDIYGSVAYKKYILAVSIFELYKQIKGVE